MKTLKNKLKSNNSENKSDVETVVKEIDKNKTRLKNAQILMLDGELNAAEYKELKIKGIAKFNPVILNGYNR
ncbi:MAG TPA: hypothetical protein VN704_00070 [Verrucomicrobiae bacterium]|nr:hypothetical protein [Verrucomicrobiae bacterium]